MEPTNKEQYINIWQQNINKSPTCQHNLISSGKLLEVEINVVTLQEPAVNYFDKTIVSRDWIVLYPTTHTENPTKTRSIILIRAVVCKNNWLQIYFPLGDVTAAQRTEAWGTLTIFIIYK